MLAERIRRHREGRAWMEAKMDLRDWVSANEDEIRDVVANAGEGAVLVIYDYGQGWTVDAVHPSNTGCAQVQIPIDSDPMEDYDIIDDILIRVQRA